MLAFQFVARYADDEVIIIYGLPVQGAHACAHNVEYSHYLIEI